MEFVTAEEALVLLPLVRSDTCIGFPIVMKPDGAATFTVAVIPGTAVTPLKKLGVALYFLLKYGHLSTGTEVTAGVTAGADDLIVTTAADHDAEPELLTGVNEYELPGDVAICHPPIENPLAFCVVHGAPGVERFWAKPTAVDRISSGELVILPVDPDAGAVDCPVVSLGSGDAAESIEGDVPRPDTSIADIPTFVSNVPPVGVTDIAVELPVTLGSIHI